MEFVIGKFRIILSKHVLEGRYVYIYTQVAEWSRMRGHSIG